MLWHHMAIRNNGNQEEHSIQAIYGGGGSKNGDKEEEVIKRKVCQTKRILYDLKESHEHVIIVDLNIISLEIVMKGRKRQNLWKMGLKVKLKMDSVGLQF